MSAVKTETIILTGWQRRAISCRHFIEAETT